MSLLVKAIYLITYFYLSNFIIKVAQADIVVVAYDNFSNYDLYFCVQGYSEQSQASSEGHQHFQFNQVQRPGARSGQKRYQ